MTRKKLPAPPAAPAAIPSLHDEDLREVAGGRKAGSAPKEYLKLTLTEAMITSVSLS